MDVVRALVLLAVCVMISPVAIAQSSGPTSGDKAPLKPEELDALVAPLALYPDSLLTQIMMAATYPIEVVQADRWIKQNKDLKGDALATALEKQTWDASVKSLANFPDVLAMMSDKLDWTVKLGDAFIEQQTDVLDAVQRLRAKAQAAGNLTSNEQQTVTAAAAPAGSSTTQIITIEPTNPQVIYVPVYNPTVVYGAWPYPYYPPYYYYPPGYVARPGLWFGAGFACGMAWGYAWGHCNWGHGNVDIDINRNININNTHIDRTKYQNEFNKRDTNIQGNRSNWQHDPSHRQGVAYRDQATAQKFGGTSSVQATQARDAYRGRADTGRQNIAAGGANQYGGSALNRTPAQTPNRTGSSLQNRAGSSYNPPGNAGTRSGAYNGINQGGNATRDYSQRGSASRAGSYGGGGGRAGGGARGGGGRR